MGKKLGELPKGARVVVHVAPDGAIHSAVDGLRGPSCEGFLDNLADLFEFVSHGDTPDMRVVAPVVVR